MAVILNHDDSLFELYNYENEASFENDVVEHAEYIFGSSSIYIDIKKRVKGNNIITIPDGYVLDLADPEQPKLFVVENEIVGHDPFKHIGIQMLKFVTSFEDAQRNIRNFLMEEIDKDKNKYKKLEQAVSESTFRNIDAYLDEAVYGDFKGLVIIDEAREELHQVIRRINANISVLEFKAYVDSKGRWLMQYDTLYDEYEEPSIAKNGKKKIDPATKAMRRKRRAKADTVIVPAREEGFKEVFLGQDQWYSIRIGAAMKDKLRYIAAYQVAPESKVTHIAEIECIKPYKDTGKYIVVFKNSAKKLKRSIPVKDVKYAPQGPTYVSRDDLLKASYLEQATFI
tara:strand:- start:50 stop:1072 length:1023 start_codon:yes stop_codon:yes gene_type:complete